jgi:ABC-2 type transport system ATP-binding protein
MRASHATGSRFHDPYVSILRMHKTAIGVTGLRKVYSRTRKSRVTALENVTFSIASGEVVGLLGSNGAGKTTTLKCVCTLVRPTAGDIHVCGDDALLRPRQALSHLAAVLEGNRNIYWHLTPAENMEFFAGLRGLRRAGVRRAVADLLEQFDLREKAGTPARMLSRGMQQKLALACALVQQTRVLLLDEPTLGLDVKTTHELRGLLKAIARAGDRTILLSSHDMQVVQDVCDRVVIISKGRVVADGAVQSLLASYRPRSYRISLDAAPSASQRAILDDRFGTPRIEAMGDLHWVEMEIAGERSLYDVMDVFRDGGLIVSSVHRHAPNLEEVFLDLTNH